MIRFCSDMKASADTGVQAFVVLRLADKTPPLPHRLSEYLGQRGALAYL